MCLLAGMDDYLSKPFNRRQMAEVFKRWIGGSRPCFPKQAEGKENRGAEQVGLFLEQPVSQEVCPIDAGAVIERLGGEEPLFFSLLPNFIQLLESELPMIRKAFDRGDFGAAALGAHSLKGAAANLSAHELENAASRLTAALRKGVHEESDELLAVLEQSCARTATFARRLLSSRLPEKEPVSEEPRPGPASMEKRKAASRRVPVFSNRAEAIVHLRQIRAFIKAHDPIGTRKALAGLKALFTGNDDRDCIKRLSTFLSDYDFENALNVVADLEREEDLFDSSPGLAG